LEIRNYIKCGSYFLSVLFLSLSIAGTAICKTASKPKLPITVHAEVDKNSVTIGDKIRYTINVSAKKDIEIKFPNFAENLAGFAVKDFGSSKRIFFGRKKLVQWYILDTYTTGKYKIPKAVIKYKKKDEKEWSNLETAELQIEVKTILDKGAADIRDIENPVNFPKKWTVYIIMAAVLVLLVSGLLVHFLRKKKEKKEVSLRKPAHELAYKMLENLRKGNLVKQHKIKQYYIELSLIVRHYLENRFSIKAPEMTTEEFLLKIKESKELFSRHRESLKEFLSHCDMVKFAKYGPNENEIDLSFQSAKKLVDQTKLD